MITIPKKVVFFLISIFLWTVIVILSLEHFFPSTDWYHDWEPVIPNGRVPQGFAFDVLFSIAWVHICIWLAALPKRFPQKMTKEQAFWRIFIGTAIIILYICLSLFRVSLK